MPAFSFYCLHLPSSSITVSEITFHQNSVHFNNFLKIQFIRIFCIFVNTIVVVLLPLPTYYTTSWSWTSSSQGCSYCLSRVDLSNCINSLSWQVTCVLSGSCCSLGSPLLNRYNVHNAYSMLSQHNSRILWAYLLIVWHDKHCLI